MSEFEKHVIKRISNLITQIGFRLMKKYKCKINELGIEPVHIKRIAIFIESGVITSKLGEVIFENICERKRGVG